MYSSRLVRSTETPTNGSNRDSQPRQPSCSILFSPGHACRGRNPVHVCIDPTRKWLIVSTLAVPGHVLSLPIAADGTLGPVASALLNPGTPGPHKTSQLGPNPHHAVFDPSGKWLAIADRGFDRVFVATLNATTGELKLNDPGWVQTRELEGPRHIAFHPTRARAYLVTELRCDVTTFAWDDKLGTLNSLQVLPSHEASFTGDVRGGEVQVHPSGKTVYVSNRSGAGDDSPGGPAPDTIGVFAVDRRTGALAPSRWISTRGIRPRFFGLTPSGASLLAANEVSDSIAGFDLAANGSVRNENGLVAQTGSPVSIVFAKRSR
jgi:6-phosphogluconolactonase (cycloisomerase 2 family)